MELSSLEAVIVNGSEEKKTLVPSTDYDQYTLQWKKDGAGVGMGKELTTTRSGSLSVYRLMVNGAFNSNEVKLVDIKLPTAVRITTNTGVAELQDKQALDHSYFRRRFPTGTLHLYLELPQG